MGQQALSARQHAKLRSSIRIMIIGAFLGVLYTFFSDGFGVLYPHINTAIIGFLVGALISFLEFYAFPKFGRRIQFIVLVVLRTLIYIILISAIVFFVLAISRMIRLDMTMNEVLNSPEFQHYVFEEDFGIALVYTIGLAFIINFTNLISRKMGQGVLWGIVSGKYYDPRETIRIVMFLGIREADDIVQRIGRSAYHRFLNELIHDITEPILEHHGVLYEYIDDEVIAYWEPDEGCMNANCINAFFKAKRVINNRSSRYMKKYGVVPELEAGIHLGKVVWGELGDIKTSIVLFGDPMNATARIKGQCKKLAKDLIISKTLRNVLDLPNNIKTESCGRIELRGKQDKMELFEVDQIQKERKNGPIDR